MKKLDNFNPDTPLFRLAQDVENHTDIDLRLSVDTENTFPKHLPDRMTKAEMQDWYAELYAQLEYAQESRDEIATQAYRINTLGMSCA